MEECRNCKYMVKKGVRRCEACGILNPTVKVKDIMITMISILVVMYIFTTFIK